MTQSVRRLWRSLVISVRHSGSFGAVSAMVTAKPVRGGILRDL